MLEVGASDTDNAVITAAAEVLRERYPAMFKPSHACRPPHVNIDVFRAELHKAGVLSRESITTADALLAWVDARNVELGSRDAAAWGLDDDGMRAKSGAALAKALAKAHEHSFYLG